jgi:hypothetical protein
MLENSLLIEVRERFFHLHEALEDYQKATDAHKAKLADLKDKGKNYRPEFLEKQITDEKARYKEKRQTIFDQYKDYADELVETIQEIDNRPIEPERMAVIRDAVELIQSGAIDHQRADQINRSFDGDQQALKTLKKVYSDGGLPDGGIDSMINNQTIDLSRKLRDIGWDAILGEGSVNAVGRFIGDLANCYAVHKYDWQINKAGFAEMARRGAGLPEEAPDGQ